MGEKEKKVSRGRKRKGMPRPSAEQQGKGGNTVIMPKKAKYRQRAHSNPLMDAHFDTPMGPEEVAWEEYYPELYTAAKERGDEPPQVAFADVGCGFGGMTIALAKEYPDKLVAGMEIRQKVSEYVKQRILALRQKEPGCYQNAASIRCNTMKHITHYFRKGQLEKMFFLFPDPHFKVSNHRRRIIQTALLDEYAYLMAPGGMLYTITDVEDLAVWMREKLEAHPLFECVPDEELKDDPAATMIENVTEEGQKVKKNNGQMWKSVFRRRRM